MSSDPAPLALAPTGIDPDLWRRLSLEARAKDRGEPAHDFFHVTRVVQNAITIARRENANGAEPQVNEAIVATAALLHELFTLPKSHPESSTAGDRCAEHARALLIAEKAPEEIIDPICAAIRDHAFSKGVVPEALESRVLQDADRLDALGAIGLARMWATCADMKRPFYAPEDPLAKNREPDDKSWGLDHVFKKLLRIPERLHLETSRQMANERSAFLRTYVEQLEREIAGSPPPPPSPAAVSVSAPAAFERIVADAPDGIVISREGMVLYANAAAARLLGHDSAENLIGQSMGTFLDPESLATMRRRIQQMMITGEVSLIPRDYPATRRDGTKITAEIVSTVVQWPGESRAAPAVLAFARDVTERSRLQAQLAHTDRLAAMGMIAAGVAHEINNPLGFIRLATEVLERKLTPPNAKYDVVRDLIPLARDMRDGVDRISAIVRDLCVFGRYEDEPVGAVDPTRSLSAALRLVAHEVTPRARVRNECDGIELPAVMGVGTRLEQVFVNLLLNAAFVFSDSATPPSGTIVIRPTLMNEEKVILEVTDDGPGMPPEILARVFEPFFTSKPGGSGLGLSICRGIVERAGGSLTASSDEGHGDDDAARSSARIGAAASASSSSSSIIEGGRPSRPPVRAPARRLRVLVIDDESRIVDLVQSLLEGEHDVIGETSAKRALEILGGATTATFDAVLCDLMMPELTGMDLHASIAETNPDLAARFIFVTGGAYTDRGRAVLSSISTRLMKPFSGADLRAALAEATD